MKKTLTLVALLIAAILTITACGNSTGKTGSSGNNNKQDVTFAQDMIPHHQQAVQMANMATSRASSSQVKQLAADIKAAQGPEITTMTGWLQAWGEKVPSGSMSGMGGGMPGMMSTRYMNKLGNATGATFDQMWLLGMTGHHEGAVEMANTEIAKGQNTDAIALAKSIKAAQTREIAKMKTMLNP